MAGVLGFTTRVGREMKMGYAVVTTDRSCPLFGAGLSVKGQLCHVTEIASFADSSATQRTGSADLSVSCCFEVAPTQSGSQSLPEGYCRKNVLASFVSLHFGSNPAFARDLVYKCSQARTDSLLPL